MSANVLLVGVGGIGHPCALALATREDIRLTLLDDDRVERTNLHRLLAFDEQHVGRTKAEALADHVERSLGARRPEVIVDRASPDTVADLVDRADVVVEGSDNFATKFLMADACALANKRSVHGAAVGWTGTVLSVVPSKSACYRCVFEDVPDGEAVDCATAGVFAAVTSMIGAVMASHVRWMLRPDAEQEAKLSHFDATTGMFRHRTMKRRPDCALCREARVITAIDASRYSAPLCSH
jgi:molybdopterin/thiamine biosynthesis adenylyltransferase